MKTRMANSSTHNPSGIAQNLELKRNCNPPVKFEQEVELNEVNYDGSSYQFSGYYGDRSTSNYDNENGETNMKVEPIDEGERQKLERLDRKRSNESDVRNDMNGQVEHGNPEQDSPRSAFSTGPLERIKVDRSVNVHLDSWEHQSVLMDVFKEETSPASLSSCPIWQNKRHKPVELSDHWEWPLGSLEDQLNIKELDLEGDFMSASNENSVPDYQSCTTPQTPMSGITMMTSPPSMRARAPWGLTPRAKAIKHSHSHEVKTEPGHGTLLKGTHRKGLERIVSWRSESPARERKCSSTLDKHDSHNSKCDCCNHNRTLLRPQSSAGLVSRNYGSLGSPCSPKSNLTTASSSQTSSNLQSSASSPLSGNTGAPVYQRYSDDEERALIYASLHVYLTSLLEGGEAKTTDEEVLKKLFEIYLGQPSTRPATALYRHYKELKHKRRGCRMVPLSERMNEDNEFGRILLTLSHYLKNDDKLPLAVELATPEQ